MLPSGQHYDLDLFEKLCRSCRRDTCSTNIQIPRSTVKFRKVGANLPPIGLASALNGIDDVDALHFVEACARISQPPPGNIGTGHGVDRKDLKRDRLLLALRCVKLGERGEDGGAERYTCEEVDAIRVIYKIDGKDVGRTRVGVGGVDKQRVSVDEVLGVC